MWRFLFISTLLILFVIFSPQGISQDAALSNPEQFLFPDFSVGIVKLKDGKRVPLKLNYNVVTEKMVFIQNNQLYDMTDYDKVDTIYISSHRFIPRGKSFPEVLVNDSISLYVQHKGIVQPPPRPAAYGGTSQVSSSTYINNLSLGNDVYRYTQKPEIIIVKPDPSFIIRIDNTYHNFISEKQLLKIFSNKRPEIRKFIHENKLDVGKQEDVIKIIDYCNSQGYWDINPLISSVQA
jgi:hypothetical protein